MKEADLLQDIGTVFKAVGEAEVVEAVDETNVTVMAVSIFEDGISEASKKPTAQRRTIRYYVLNRGEANESAYYMQIEPKNQVDSDVTAKDASLLSMFRVYSSASLRQKVQAAMVKAAFDILHEDTTVVDHANRILWAGEVFANNPAHLNTMMAFVSQNAVVQAAGGLATDNDVQYIINSSIAYTFHFI